MKMLTANNTLQVTFDPLPIFAAAKKASPQMHLNVGVMKSMRTEFKHLHFIEDIARIVGFQ